MSQIRFEFEPLRQLNFGLITGNLTQVGGNFEHPLRKIVIYSILDVDAVLSFDGVTDHWFIPSQSSVILDVGPEPAIAKKEGVWVRHIGVAPTSGAIYVSAMYGFRP